MERLGVWPQARLHTQWPGAGVMGDPVFDAFYEGNAAFEADTVVQQHRMRAGLVELLRRERMGSDVVVLTHSQGGLFGWGIADVVGVRGVVALEPTGPPFENAVFSREGGVRGWGMVDIPLRYDPPVGDPGKDLELVRVGVDTPEKVSCLLQKEGRVRKLVGLAKVPVLVVTAQASFHAVYDHCSVEYLRQAGVDTEWYRLEEMGQKGNGHMMFMEKNSWEIWRLVEGWIDRLK